MHNSKLITILKSLNPTEFRQFYRYLQAPLLTQSKDVLNLYNVVRRYYPAFDSPKLDRQKIYKKLFPKKAFDTNRFSALLFKLTKILDEYLIFLKFQQDEFQKKKLLTQIYSERNLNVIFKKNTEELLEELEGQPCRDSQYFYDKYFLQQDYYLHINTPKKGQTVELLKDAITNLENFAHLERLRLGIDLVNRERIFSERHYFDDNNFSTLKLDENIIYELLKNSLTLIKKEEGILFFKVKEQLIKHIGGIPNSYSLPIFQILSNYAIRQLPKNENNYLPALFDLYKIGIKKRLLFADDKISPSLFLNIVTVSANLKAYDYAAHFMESHQQFLHGGNKDAIIHLANSYLFFTKEKYGEVLSLLQNFDFLVLLDKISAKLLLIKTYYQIAQNDLTFQSLVLSNCVALEKSLKREQKINPQKKEAIFNFLLIMRKVVNYQASYSTNNMSKNKLIDLFTNFEVVVNRNWIKKILEQL